MQPLSDEESGDEGEEEDDEVIASDIIPSMFGCTQVTCHWVTMVILNLTNQMMDYLSSVIGQLQIIMYMSVT